jgi:VanZ family protein
VTPVTGLRYRRWWQAAGYALVVILTVNSLIPWPQLAEAPDNFDKWLHAGAYLALTLWFCGVHERRRWPLVAVGLLLLGAAIEFAQGRTGYRQADLFDMAANTAGITLGLVLAAAGAGGWCRWLESLLPDGKHA